MYLIRKALPAIGLLLLTLSTASAQGLPQSIILCAVERQDAARLACFDREVERHVHASEPVASAPLPSAQPATPTPPVAVTQPQNSNSAVDDFGVAGDLARKRKEADQQAVAPLKELHAKVVKVTTKVHGELVIELDNGQIWEQPEKKNGLLIKSGEQVRIKPGAMSSFFLTADSGATTRIRRVR
jgi:hypothetical protein